MSGPIGRRQKGERVLASATTVDGVLVAGTRDTLMIGARRIPWEGLQSADWDKESTTLRVAEVGDWGEERPVHVLILPDPGRLLQLVRERLTASVVLQRHVAVRGRKGVFVIARRAPRGDGPLQWVYEFQEGIDPTDPAVRRAAEAALAAARDEVGLP
jgi:hypothetical protein